MPEGKKHLSGPEGPKFTTTRRFPFTVLLAAPFFFIIIPLYRAARHSVDWAAAAAMILTFEALMFAAEFFSVSRGHWVWNPDRIVGPTIFGIPLEEPLLYYWFPPLFVVVLMHALKNRLDGRKGEG